MNTLVYLELEEGSVKKSSLEAIVFAKQLDPSATLVGLTIGAQGPGGTETLSGLGLSRLLLVTDNRLEVPEAQAVTAILSQAIEQEGARYVVMARSSLTDAVAPRVAAREKAALGTNVIEVIEAGEGRMVVKRSIYTGKAFAHTELTGSRIILTIKKNAVEVPADAAGSPLEATPFSANLTDKDFAVKRTGIEKATGQILLPEAEVVVSGGRGMKGPENWGLIENLAEALGAATGCSKPVSDMGWRPHHEHVGQTGIKVSPTLYVAVGISGAIQHVAGINSSKVIVAINKDAEAPIFKVADYGMVGDAFDILPRLTSALQ